jgi:mannose-1-phosphate guanylyltransferase/mannose-6-phosphate isomerase
LAERGNKIVPVILSGGSGTRLWPVSRKSFPKQFWPLISEHSMLAETALARRMPRLFTPPIVVTNQEHRFVVAEQLRNAGISGAQVVLEPVGRNSAPAIAAAALLASRNGPGHRSLDHGRRCVDQRPRSTRCALKPPSPPHVRAISSPSA